MDILKEALGIKVSNSDQPAIHNHISYTVDFDNRLPEAVENDVTLSNLHANSKVDTQELDNSSNDIDPISNQPEIEIDNFDDVVSCNSDVDNSSTDSVKEELKEVIQVTASENSSRVPTLKIVNKLNCHITLKEDDKVWLQFGEKVIDIPCDPNEHADVSEGTECEFTQYDDNTFTLVSLSEKSQAA